MIVNGLALLRAAPILNMLDHKVRGEYASHGLTEAGYDIQLAQEVLFSGGRYGRRFQLASAMEYFQMPPDLVGVVHDKSTWARCGLSVFNTVIEPGWRGFLTLELAYWGDDELYLPAGTGIAQVLFQTLAERASYEGKYQDQGAGPVRARWSSTPNLEGPGGRW